SGERSSGPFRAARTCGAPTHRRCWSGPDAPPDRRATGARSGAEQVARDYGVEYARLEAEAAVVALPAGASETDSVYEGWEVVRMGGLVRVEVRLGGKLVGTWDHSGVP